MDAVDIARWQFGITTVYHFLMVPLTIGLGPCVAWFQFRWVRTGDERWLRMVKFWGKLYLINFILGVATGLVQEFQFGMAWSSYSRFVGDVFGAPLALEGLLAVQAGANPRLVGERLRSLLPDDETAGDGKKDGKKDAKKAAA